MNTKLGFVLSAILLAPVLMVSCGSGSTSKPPASPTPTVPVSEDISWQMDDTTVTATITRPDDSDVHPAMVFIAGSGPTDRNWNSALLPGTNGSAALLADAMAREG